METRMRGIRRLQPKSDGYKTKKESNKTHDRRSLPQCPPLRTKVVRSAGFQKSLFSDSYPAKAVFYTKPVSLSRIYNPERGLSYFEQLFVRSEKIGEGSFGEVYKARSREDDKSYAIKQLKASHHINYGYAEVKNYEKIGDHNNCVKLILAWEEAKMIHIQMEYCQFSLEQFANSAHDIAENQLWAILYDILGALDFLHKKKLIHLDVKPGNIMMSKGMFKLADFGLLVDLNQHDGRKISTISDGDAKYLACEVLDGIYTYACDIFGLGITILEVATNIILPEFGPLWHQIRKETLPNAFYEAVSSQFAVTVEQMMSLSHFKRPSAAKILKYPALRDVCKRDEHTPREVFGLNDDDEVYYEEEVAAENNNIVTTPKRPLHEVRKSWAQGDIINVEANRIVAPPNTPNDSIKELVDGDPLEMTQNRKGLPRVKLSFA